MRVVGHARPKRPNAAKTLRSAVMPAPEEGSNPAIVSTAGGGASDVPDAGAKPGRVCIPPAYKVLQRNEIAPIQQKYTPWFVSAHLTDVPSV